MEFFYDSEEKTLYAVPPAGVDLTTATVVAAQHRRVIQFRGSDDTTFAEHITMSGFTFAHSDPTYLADYEMPSGGDWTISRNGMVFVDGAEHITLKNNTFDQAGGNGLFLSQHAWHTVVDGNTFLFAGDSAVALVGSTDLMNGTRPTYVAYTNITNNLMYEVGVYGKQTAALFKSIAYRTNIVNNVALNGPRSGFNFNVSVLGRRCFLAPGIRACTLGSHPRMAQSITAAPSSGRIHGRRPHGRKPPRRLRPRDPGSCEIQLVGQAVLVLPD
jgi:hypothetical protein